MGVFHVFEIVQIVPNRVNAPQIRKFEFGAPSEELFQI